METQRRIVVIPHPHYDVHTVVVVVVNSYSIILRRNRNTYSNLFTFIITLLCLRVCPIYSSLPQQQQHHHHQQQQQNSIDRVMTSDVHQNYNDYKSKGMKRWWGHRTKQQLSTNGLFRTLLPALFAHDRKRKLITTTNESTTTTTNIDMEHNNNNNNNNNHLWYNHNNNNNNNYKNIDTTLIRDVSVKTTATATATTIPDRPRRRLSIQKISPQISYKFFLGITPQTIQSLLSNSKQQQQQTSSLSSSSSSPRRSGSMNLQEGMSEALDELRSLRRQMEYMQKEITTLKQLQLGISIIDEPTMDHKVMNGGMNQQQRIREYETIAKDVERWAERILFPSSSSSSSSSSSTATTSNTNIDDTSSELLLDGGWVEIPCHKMFKQKWNRNGMTRAYLKYMKDSRSLISNTVTSEATKSISVNDADVEWPCVRLYSIIDAPCSEVCTYLSQERHASEYNQLLDKYHDLDVITSHSKICFASSPQLLFIKPRDLITFCSHRWKRDGTQIVINQACDRYGDRVATAFALRGATYISPDPNDPDHKTQIAMLAHASPGNDLPKWACRTAIQSLLPIEPYRLFYKINEGIQQCRPELQALYQRTLERISKDDDDDDTNDKSNMTEMVGNNMGGRPSNSNISRSPAGLAQMGYACFWPNGGGTIDAISGSPTGTVGSPLSLQTFETESTIQEEESTSISEEVDESVQNNVIG